MPDYMTNLLEGGTGCLQSITALAWVIFSLIWLVKVYMDGQRYYPSDWFWFLAKPSFYLGFLAFIPYGIVWALLSSLAGFLWLWCGLGLHLLVATIWLGARRVRHPMDSKLCYCHPIVWPFWFPLRRAEAEKRQPTTKEVRHD